MTPPQATLIRRLVDAERFYWQQRLAGESADHEYRCVEVSRTFGVDPRTAQSLMDAGVIDGHSTDNNRWIVWLKGDEDR